jgi:hypothetical protein
MSMLNIPAKYSNTVPGHETDRQTDILHSTTNDIMPLCSVDEH